MEMIIRIQNNQQDVEILYNNLVAEEITEKKLSYNKFMEIFANEAKKNDGDDQTITYFGLNVIGYVEGPSYKKYLINQPAHKRYITWTLETSSATKINFPNSIYEIKVIKNRVSTIKAYMYLKWNDKNTILYKYAMPNMLTENNICIGNANTTFNGNILESLENIIYAPYSHRNLNNVKGFANTEQYFNYLKENHIQEKHLYPIKKKLGDIVQ